MASIPGAPVIAAHYGEAMVLYSELERVGAVVDGAPANSHGHTLGRLYIVEPNKPTKVPYEAGRFILDHLGYTGVVQVDITETDSGTRYDIPKAQADSRAKLKESDELRFKSWISGVIDDYVKRNKPVPQPDDSIMAVIARRGYDLKAYGIVPIGWAEKGKADELQALRDELASLRAQLASKADAAKPATAPPKER